MSRSLLVVASIVLAAACAGGEGDTSPTASAQPGPSSTSKEAPNSQGAAGVTTTTPGSAADAELHLVEIGQFGRPVFVTSPVDDQRIFVVDQQGRIFVVEDGQQRVFLDLRDQVTFGGERGLLGLAFHPDHADNGLFYVNYIDRGGATVIEEYQVDANGLGEPATARLVLRIPQPAANHNGGMIAFGPDGLLWVGMGDGGGANDAFGLARDPTSLHGSMLRLAVGPGAPEPYGVPEDNMFVADDGGRFEIWATGLRNPWRWTFDGPRLYIADVGQNRLEEISVVDASSQGLDFGWSVLEGDECFGGDGCDKDGFVLPVYTYGRSDGCSITGGVVYRGSALPELAGRYFFSDYCQGWVRSIVVDDNGSVVEEIEWPELAVENPTSYGVDAAGEVYIASGDGRVFRVERATG